MIFKVFYQEDPWEAPVRERTETKYVEADSERDVRLKLSDRHFNIELIQAMSDSYIEYEKKSEQFEVER